ncbi:MAG: GerMN domain-containing protein [Acidimicrobiales bacterium]
MRRSAVIAALFAGGLGLSACGIPVSGSPQVLSRSGLPPALVQQQYPTPTASSGKPTQGKPIIIYLIQNISGDLVPVARSVRNVTVQAVIAELVAGPVSSEYEKGYESAVNTSSRLAASGPRRHIATVRLDQDFFQLKGEAPVQELGQIVWTLTKSPDGVRAVRFVGPDGPIPVEIASGRFVTRPVGQDNYCELVNPPSCKT